MTPSINPPYLAVGDKVGFIAPAGKVDPEQVTAAFEILKSWGLEVIRGKHLFSQHGYFAGNDQERLDDLQDMINKEDIKAIFCLRGGYGVTRIIDKVDLKPFSTHPKWIIGFSDITALHLKLARHGYQSLHGIMPIHFDPEKAGSSLSDLKEFIFGRKMNLQWPTVEHSIPGKAKGRLIGGNLSIMADSMGTLEAPQGKDIILFIEEIDEYLYKIDRMLMQLKRNGLFENLTGLLIGHFTSIKDTKVPFGASLQQIILEKVKGYSIPVAFGLPAGHDYPNFALPHNRTVTFEVNEKMSILKY